MSPEDNLINRETSLGVILAVWISPKSGDLMLLIQTAGGELLARPADGMRLTD